MYKTHSRNIVIDMWQVFLSNIYINNTISLSCNEAKARAHDWPLWHKVLEDED